MTSGTGAPVASMTTPRSHALQHNLPRLLLFFASGLLLLGNAIWIAQNETILGNDAGAHLVRSIEVLRAFQEPTRDMIPTIWDVSGHRPPFSYVLTVPFYLTGLSYDAALWSNMVWLFLTAGLLYFIGKRLGDEWDGVLASLLTLTTPLLFELARLYYQETLVTLLVWGAMLALLQSDGFGKRRASILFACAAGIGMLVKWTVPTFLVGPLLIVLWRYRRAWQWPTLPPSRRVLPMLATAALLAAGWSWLTAPLLESTLSLVLFWLVWTMLFSAVGVLLATQPSRTSNLLLAAALSAAIASLWYLPRSDFATLFSDLVFGDAGRPDAAGEFSLLAPTTWLFYTRALVQEQLGLLAGGAFFLALYGLRGFRARSDVQMVLAMLLSAWLIYTLSPFRDHARSITPALPGVALVLVLGLRHGFSRKWGVPLLGIVALWQVGQFALLTAEPLAPVARLLQASHLVVDGAYHFWPTSGPASPSYHIAPRVLEALQEAPTPDGRVSLGLLINDVQLHQNTLRPEFEMLAPGAVRVIPLTEDVSNPYAQLFRYPFVLYKTGGETDASPEAREAIERVVTDETGLFAAAFEPVLQQQTPSGETLILARRRYALEPLSVTESYEPLMAHLTPLLTQEDTGVVDGGSQVNPLGAFGWPETPLFVPSSEQPITQLATDLQPGTRVFAILWNQDPATEAWLDEHLVRGSDTWFGDVHLISYVVPTEEPAIRLEEVGTLGAGMLERLEIDQATLDAGGAVAVTLTWRLEDDEAVPHRTVVELYGAEGDLIAMRDLPPEQPWAAGSSVAQRVALVLPRELGPLPACLVIARYDPSTGARLLTPSGEDHLSACPWP